MSRMCLALYELMILQLCSKDGDKQFRKDSFTLGEERTRVCFAVWSSLKAKEGTITDCLLCILNQTTKFCDMEGDKIFAAGLNDHYNNP